MRRTRGTRPDTGEPFVFVSYSHLDDGFRRRFATHMAPVRREGVQTWFDGDIDPGAELDPEITRALRRADVFVALASPNYLASPYCFEREYGFALRKAARGRLRVAVVLLRQCQWRHTRMAMYKLLPHDAKPVDQWPRRGDAWEDVVAGIRILLDGVRADRASAPKRKPPATKVAAVRSVKAKPKGSPPKGRSKAPDAPPKTKGKVAPRRGTTGRSVTVPPPKKRGGAPGRSPRPRKP